MLTVGGCDMRKLDADAGRRILVVDDDRIVRKHAMEMIRRHAEGIDVLAEAKDGQQALDLLDDVLPGISLVDMRMPRLDGIGFIRAAHERYPWMQFFILSNYDEFEMVKSAFKEGVSDYVLKYELSARDIHNIIGSGRAALHQLYEKQSEERALAQSARINAILRVGELYRRGDCTFLPAGDLFFAAWFSYLPMNAPDGDAPLLANLTELLSDDALGAFAYRRTLNNRITNLCVYTPATGRNQAVAKLTLRERADAIMDRLHALGALVMRVDSEAFYRSDARTALKRLGHAAAGLFYLRKSDSISILDAQPFGEYRPIAEYTAHPLEFKQLLLQSAVDEALKRLNDTGAAIFSDRLQPAMAEKVLGRFADALSEISINPSEEPMAFDTLFFALDALTAAVKRLAAEPRRVFENEGINRAIRYIVAHLDEPLTLDAVSIESGYSRNHFSRIFKQITGTSYNGYVNTVRMHHAAELIRSGLSTADAAKRVGFTDMRYFYRVFEKYMGLSPARWLESEGGQRK